jgi:riboflavin biosynthesis pyrimidine reductase
VSARLHRLHPPPSADVSLDEFLSDARRTRHDERPWVMVTMIASVDGTTVVGGRAGALANDTDAAVFSKARALADVLLVGAGTVRAEGYGPPRAAGLRIGVVSRSGALDPASTLFTSGAGFLVVPEGTDAHGLPALRAGRGDVDLELALRLIDTVAPGTAIVGCEGGPRLNASLLDAGCIDELVLTTSPRLAGGYGPRVVSNAAPTTVDLELAALALDDDGYLFSRWVRRS